MSLVRSRMRSRLTRASVRASGAPGQVWMPRPKAMWWRAFSRSMSKVAGSSNRRGSRLAAALTSITVVPAGISMSPMVVGTRDSRKSPLTGLSIRSVSSMKLGIRCRSSRSSCWSARILGDEHEGRAEQADGGLLAGGEEVGGDPDDVDDLGDRAVGERRRGEAREHVRRGARRHSSTYDVNCWYRYSRGDSAMVSSLRPPMVP